MPDQARAWSLILPLVLTAGLILARPTLAADQQSFTRMERGRYLATLGDCNACHRDPKSGQPFAGGRPIETPFGTVSAPNITPDWETGIGSWSDKEFADALRVGRRRDGAHLYPAMPYPYFTKMTDENVRDLRAFLTTVPAVHNNVTANQLPFPFDIRQGMAAWNELYFRPGPFQLSPNKSPEWNRGAYLVEGLGHCGACHTPKSFLGGDKTERALRGSPVQGWFAPNITNDSHQGLGTWSIADIVAYLATGHNRVTAATGPMSEVVSFSTSNMSEADLMAIATYLKDAPGSPEASPSPKPTPSSPAIVAGGAIYRDVCSACHGLEGKGIPELVPSLAESPSLHSDDVTTILRVVLRGARSAATAKAPTAPAMPSYGWQLTDDQVAAVISYVRNSWGSAAHPVTPSDVAKARAALAQRTD
jgi:mono/diheme cytochrome c family protein